MRRFRRQIKKSRKLFHRTSRKTPLGTLLVITLAAILVISAINHLPAFQLQNYEDELGATGEPEQVFLDEHEARFSNTVSQALINRGESLYSILSGEGLNPAQISEITSQLKTCDFSAKSVKPGKTYLIEKDPSGRFLCFTYQQSPSRALHIEQNPEKQTFNIWQETFEHEKRISALTGSISSNLAAELQQQKRYALITQLQQIFSHQINFKRDIHPGTAYNILFEEKWLNGELVGIGNILAAEIHIDNKPATAYRYTDAKGKTGYFNEKGKAINLTFASSFFINPCRYSRISSRFGYRVHPILRRRHFHGGVDFAAPRGTPVYAVADGRITFRGRKGAAGNMITIKHGNGYRTKYLHLSRFSSKARHGSRVKQGQVIGYVGSTGRSTGPHLDFRVLRGGKLQNPLVALKNASTPIRTVKSVPKGEMKNFLAMVSDLRAQLHNNKILVADNAKSITVKQSALN